MNANKSSRLLIQNQYFLNENSLAQYIEWDALARISFVSNLLNAVYGDTTFQIIKEIIITATEKTQCTGLKFFRNVTGKERNLIESWTSICYWCCFEVVKRISPIIAEATINLINI